MDINLWAVIAAVVVMFGVGAFWYMIPFQKAWARIMGFDTLTKKQQDALAKSMTPVYGVQLLVTVISAVILTYCITAIPQFEYWKIVSIMWLGFVMPSIVSGVLFSQTAPEYRFQQISISATEAFVRLMLAAWVINLIVN